MRPLRFRQLPVLLLALLLTHSTALADYISGQWFLDGETAVGGTVRIEGYDGQGPPGGGLSAGQVRLTFQARLSYPGSDPPPPGMVWKYSGISDLSFPSALSLNVNQISMGPGWVFSGADPQPSHFGNFGEVYAYLTVTDYTQLQSTVTVLISGLGANASPNNFVEPNAWGGAFAVQWEDTDYVPAAAPEPSTLVLGVLGVAGWLGRRALCRAVSRAMLTADAGGDLSIVVQAPAR